MVNNTGFRSSTYVRIKFSPNYENQKQKKFSVSNSWSMIEAQIFSWLSLPSIVMSAITFDHYFLVCTKETLDLTTAEKYYLAE